MKIFVYKSLIVFFIVFLAFHLTFNYALRSLERKLVNFTSKGNIEFLKEELRNQLEEAVEKEELIKKSDALLLRKFLDKVKKEIYK